MVAVGADEVCADELVMGTTVATVAAVVTDRPAAIGQLLAGTATGV